MNENEYLSLLIEIIKQDNNPHKAEIIDVLRRSKLAFEKTEEYTHHKWNYYNENIYITLEPTDLIAIQPYIEYIIRNIRKIYPVNDSYMYELARVEFKPGRITDKEIVSQEIHFDDIQKQIIEEIKNAKYIIWVAMAWFTNKALFDELIEKQKQGVNVQIVIDDNEKNKTAPFDLEKSFETYKVNIQSIYKNIMHDKFCIIDLNTVIHGTFNWTNAANYNRETICIDKNSVIARQFADEFINLKKRKYG